MNSSATQDVDRIDVDLIEVTPGRLRKLLSARLVEGSTDVTLVDRRHPVDLWRSFARSTVLPLAVGFAVAAAAAGFLSLRDADKREALALACLAGALATSVAALTVLLVGRRARPRFATLRELLADSIHPGREAEARALLKRPSIGAKVGVVLVTVAAAPLFPLVDDLARDEGELCALAGLTMMVVSAVLTRRTWAHVVVRHLGVVLGPVGVLWLAASLTRHLNLPWQQKPLVALAVFAVGIVAIRSLPVRMAGVGALAAGVLVALGELGVHGVERADDLAFIALAIVTTFALTRPRMKGAFALASAVVLLVLAAVEHPELGRETGLALGTASSLGAIACLVALTLVVTRGASQAARALVATLVACTGFVLIDAPAVLAAVLVVGLARHARVRPLEVGAMVALGGFVWVRASTSYASLDDIWGTFVVAALLLAAAGVTLRRLPPKEAAPPSGLAGIGSAASATSTAAPSLTAR